MMLKKLERSRNLRVSEVQLNALKRSGSEYCDLRLRTTLCYPKIVVLSLGAYMFVKFPATQVCS